MPRYSEPRKSTSNEPATVFEAVARVIAGSGRKDVINLHLGDSHSLPPVPARPSSLDEEKWSGFGRYCQTQGIPELKELLVKKVLEANGMDWVGEEHLQITCGAIHALYATFAALLDRDGGEEVMVLSPHWHLTNGVIRQAGGCPVDTDFYIPLCEAGSGEGAVVEETGGVDVTALLEAGLSERTCAIYLNTPCNPTGKVLDRAVLEEVARFAIMHDLWVVSDEAYENFIYTDAEHVSMATLPGMADRTVSIFTFSKCLAASGYRVGYAVAHPELIDKIHQASTLTIYNAPTDNQHLVIQALEGWDRWFPGLYENYKQNRDLVCRNFKGRFFEPEGSFYVFFDARDLLGDRPAEELLEEMVAQGVAAVPGRAFGRGFEQWFRFCFVAVPEEVLAEGIERLNRVVAP